MSGRILGKRAGDGVATHPDDSFLLAYIRQQPLGNHWPDIDLHLIDCPECAKRVRELQEISASLDVGLLPSARNQSLASEDVAHWNWLDQPELAQRQYQRRSRERSREDLSLILALLTHLPQLFLVVSDSLRQALLTRIPVAITERVQYQNLAGYKPGVGAKHSFQVANLIVVLVLTCLVTALVVFAAVRQPFASPGPVKLFPPLISTVHATETPHPTPGSAKKATATVSVTGAKTTASITKPTISLCLTPQDKNQHRMHICGVNFKPGDKVLVMLEFAGSNVRIPRSTVTVGMEGRFEDVWALANCRSIPTTIVAQDVDHPNIASQELQIIQFSGCPIANAGHH